MSLSARRAWIEIFFRGWTLNINGVALRKESVDRNGSADYVEYNYNKSLSARRAWIEMLVLAFTNFSPTVALRKESVDRNANPVLNA